MCFGRKRNTCLCIKFIFKFIQSLKPVFTVWSSDISHAMYTEYRGSFNTVNWDIPCVNSGSATYRNLRKTTTVKKIHCACYPLIIILLAWISAQKNKAKQNDQWCGTLEFKSPEQQPNNDQNCAAAIGCAARCHLFMQSPYWVHIPVAISRTFIQQLRRSRGFRFFQEACIAVTWLHEQHITSERLECNVREEM